MSSYKPLQVYNEKNEWFVYDKNNKKNTFKSKEKADYFVRTYYADEFKGKRIDRKKVYTPKQIETLEKSDAKVDSISTAQGIDPGPEIQPDPKTDPQPDYTPNIEVNGEEFTKQNWTDAKQSLLNEGNALFDEYDRIKFELESKYFQHPVEGVSMEFDGGYPVIGPVFAKEMTKLLGNPRETLTNLPKA